jgi:hypothetical protein
VFDAVGGLDETLGQAEDLDFLLRIARRFSSYGHGRIVSVYRRHDQSVTWQRPQVALRSSLDVLKTHRPYVRANPQYAAAHRTAIQRVLKVWRRPLLERVRSHARAGRWGDLLADGALLLRHYPRTFVTHAVRKLGVTLGIGRAEA